MQKILVPLILSPTLPLPRKMQKLSRLQKSLRLRKQSNGFVLMACQRRKVQGSMEFLLQVAGHYKLEKMHARPSQAAMHLQGMSIKCGFQKVILLWTKIIGDQMCHLTGVFATWSKIAPIHPLMLQLKSQPTLQLR